MLFFLLFEADSAFAQNELDSLLRVLKMNKSIIAQVNSKIEIGEMLQINRLPYWDSLINDCKEKILSEKQYFIKKKIYNLCGRCYSIKAFIVMDKLQDSQSSITNFRTAVYYLGNGIDLPSIAEAYNNIGYIYSTLFDYKNSIKFYQKSIAIKLLVGDSLGMANTTSYLAGEYQKTGDFKKALELHHNCLAIREKLNDSKLIAKSLNSIHAKQNNYETALKFLQKAIEENKKKDDSLAIAVNLNNMAYIYENQLRNKGKLSPTKFDSLWTNALNYFSESLKIQKQKGYSYGVANCLNNLGLLFMEKVYNTKNEFIKDSLIRLSENNHMNALEIYKTLHDKSGIINSKNDLAALLLYKRELSKALKYGIESYELAHENNYPEDIRNSCSTLFKIYKALNLKSEALAFYETYIEMRDSLNSISTQDEAKRQQFRYEWEKHEDEIKLSIEKKEAITLEEKKKQNIILYCVVIGLIVVFIFSVLLYKRFKIANKQKMIIEEQKQNTEIALHLLHEKNKEVMDSIRYAARIQRSLITSERYISKRLNR